MFLHVLHAIYSWNIDIVHVNIKTDKSIVCPCFFNAMFIQELKDWQICQKAVIDHVDMSCFKNYGLSTTANFNE